MAAIITSKFRFHNAEQFKESFSEAAPTNYYLFRRLKDSGIKISSIARGIAIGDELEYTDEITLGTAISSRMPYSE